MYNPPFLTDLDSRAAVKGSRDPLGIMQLWTRFGRHVVGNLTTVSNSVRDFTTLLLGYYFAEQLAGDLGPGSELATFLKWEQLAAYARAHVNHDWAFRGTERVRRNLSESSRITLSDDRAHQILGNQKIYGLWGLYTVPARASGLVDGDPPRLTPLALERVERLYMPQLVEGAGRDARRIREALEKSTRLDRAKKGDAKLLQVVGKVLKLKFSAREREFYREHLLYGGPQDATGGLQRQLAELMISALPQQGFYWSPAVVTGLAQTARSRGGEWDSLAHYLHRIQTSEAVMAPVSMLFTHLLGMDGKTGGDVVQRLKQQWGTGLRHISTADFRQLRAEIGEGDNEAGDRWVDIAEALSGGEYSTLLDLLLTQNKAVMAARGGTPWIEKRAGRLHVRFREEQGWLPAEGDLESLWRFPYFLDSLRVVGIALKDR